MRMRSRWISKWVLASLEGTTMVLPSSPMMGHTSYGRVGTWVDDSYFVTDIRTNVTIRSAQPFRYTGQPSSRRDNFIMNTPAKRRLTNDITFNAPTCTQWRILTI
ncbi:hypothetical protein AVEN_42820-1 [Araneus ventricosus]|uniref:Secreted protein n=1 Tax=Araneus ventricosus TaxID=182803 RepID=A0A4Y2AEK6_ARAVE|nr:hypothetical protein AVEN_42820-1 [Araneus ventricosus]